MEKKIQELFILYRECLCTLRTFARKPGAVSKNVCQIHPSLVDCSHLSLSDTEMPRQETNGVILALMSAALYGIFPVVVNRGSHHIMPLTFAAISTLLAAVGSFIYTAVKGKLYELKKKETYASLLMVTLCIVIIPYVLFFIGSSKTSGINTSLLLLSEVVFTLMFTPFIGEKTTFEKLAGAVAVLVGAGLILYNGKLRLNMGDLMVIASTATFPIGNFYAKRALIRVSPRQFSWFGFLSAAYSCYFLPCFWRPRR